MWNSYRLPLSTIPLYYNILIYPLIDKSVFAGKIEIKTINKTRTDQIVLHGLNLTINNALIENNNCQYKIDNIKYDKDLEFIYLIDKDHFDIGEITIYLEYQGVIYDDMYGLYKSSYSDNKDQIVLSTQFESTFARRAYPCFDEPELKAPFTLSLVVPRDMMAYSNMPLWSRETMDENNDFVVFQTSPPMSTYNLAFVIGVYEKLTSREGNISVLAPPGNLPESEFGLFIAVNSIKAYEEVLGIKYTLPKLDLIIVPESAAGAMENWGLLTFRRNALLTYDNHSSENDIDYVVYTVSHELAHQYFGNLCTLNWWENLWLNEGIATYFEYIGMNKALPQWNIWDEFVVNIQQVAMTTDKLLTSHPLNKKLLNNDDISEMFDGITYNKGGSIIYMVSNIVGEKIFFPGLQRYLTKCAFGNGYPDLVWESIEEEALAQGRPVNLTASMKSWTDQSGYPLITIEEQENKIRLKQQRYLPYNDDYTDTRRWWISTTIYHADGTHSKVEFSDEKSEFIPLRGSWCKINYGQYTLARVNYPVEMWYHIVTKANLSPSDRAGLLNDALTLSIDDKLSVTVALDIMYKILSKERNYNVWKSAISSLYKLDTLFINHDCWTYFQKYIHKLLAPTSDWIWTEGNNHETRMLQHILLILAIYFEEPNISDICNQLFYQWIHDPMSLSPDIRDVVLANAVSTLGNFAYHIVYTRYLGNKCY